jgi:hypothetical protein
MASLTPFPVFISSSLRIYSRSVMADADALPLFVADLVPGAGFSSIFSA